MDLRLGGEWTFGRSTLGWEEVGGHEGKHLGLGGVG